MQTIYGACQCGTICNDVQCPNAVGGSRHIHSNHVKCLPACHGRRTRMQRSVASCAFTAPPPASCPAAACFLLGRPSAATSELPNHVARQALAFKRYMLKPGPATSWPERVARRGRRRTFNSVVSKKTIHIPSRFNIETEEVSLVALTSILELRSRVCWLLCEWYRVRIPQVILIF